jgi:hypothetical protein
MAWMRGSSARKVRSVRLGAKLRAFAGSPLAWVVAVVAVLHAVGLGWGLPGSDGWDNDGVAPRDFLPGLAETFTPGHYYTYPPLQLALLAVLTLPISLVALFRAPALTVPAVVGEILKVPYMTAMSLGIVLAIARLAEEIRAAELGLSPDRVARLGAVYDDPRVRRAGVCAAIVAGVNASFTYYGKVSNLDVPYVFWSIWALVYLARAIRGQRSFRVGFVLAALAIATKDQAYALFLLAMPPYFVFALARDRRRARDFVIASVVALGALLVIDGAVFNPTGFHARIGFLLGPASQDYAEYTATWSGRARLLVDAAELFPLQYPFALLVFIAVGLRHLRRSVLGPLPLLVSLSFLLTFTMATRRTEARFLFPPAMLLAIYGGAGLEAFVWIRRRSLRWAGQAIASVVLALAIFRCISVDVSMLRDPRYDAEAWLAANVRPGDTIEIYGLNVYFPRFPAWAHVVRVGPEPITKRNPLPGVEEVQAPYELAMQRAPTWIVVPWGWAWRVYDHDPSEPGQMMASTLERVRAEPTKRYFHDLADQSLDYWCPHGSNYDASVFPVVDIHGTTARTIWIFRHR